MEQGLSYKIIRNTVFNIIGKTWGMLASLLLTPYIIQRIGVERFGIWAIVGITTSYLILFDFGICASFVKYIAEFYTKGEYKKINQVVNTGFAFYALLGIFVVIAFCLTIHPLLNFLKIPSYLYREALFVFMLGIIVFCLSNALNVFEAIFQGLQRMDISNKVAIAVSLCNIAGTVFFLERGWGLPGLMVNNAIILVAAGIINIFFSFRIFPHLRFHPGLFSQDMFKGLFNFGFKVQITRVAMLMNYSIVKLLTSHFLNLSLVGFYELGQKIIMLGRDSALLSVSAIMPAAAEIEARKDTRALHELYFRVSKYLHGIAIPLSSFIFASAPLIILAWTGSQYPTSVLVIRILAPAHLINMFTAAGGLIAYGMGKPGILARAFGASAVLNLVISIILITKIGFVGVVIGTSVSLIAGSIIFIYIFNRYLEISLGSFVQRTMLKPLMATVIPITVICLLMKYPLACCNISSGRITSIFLLGLNGVIFMCIYAITILKIDYLDADDRRNIIKIFNFLKLRR